MSGNKFITGLGRIFSERLLAPKLLVAPTMRVGQQWLDAAARAGYPVLNARAKTMTALALELATPDLADRGLRYAAGAELEVIVARVFAGLKKTRSDYLTRLEPTAGMVSALARSLRDLRLAGLSADRLPAAAFDQPGKAAEIKELLAAFEQALEKNHRVDYAGVLELATVAAAKDPGLLLLMGEEQYAGLNRRERELWNAFPPAARALVPVDGLDPDGPETDARLLRFIAQPERAPAPVGDGSARVFRAIGEVNEVREVFRLCLAEGVPFDDVEILHPQYDAYVPLIHETAALLTEPGAESPVTFGEGLPARLYRPGRALTAFVEWAEGDCPQSVAVRMVQDGLVRFRRNSEGDLSFTRIAAILRAVPIAAGRDRWLPALDRAITAAGRAAESAKVRGQADRGARERERAAALAELRAVFAELLDLSDPDRGQAARITGALTFLERHARGASEADEDARARLIDSIREMLDLIGDEEIPGLDPLTWLKLLPAETMVGGLGPRPGRAYVAGLRGGGHSGRGHTFILGLDDARFPGGSTQDPVLLDRERENVSSDLPRAAGRAGRAVADFALLLARLRGAVTLSYSCLDVIDDREGYPSQALLSAARILSGGQSATLSDFLRRAGPAASFAPDAPEKCLGMPEWWLHRLAGPVRVRDAQAAVASAFPNLGQGFIARDARTGERFTEYDGYVPEAGADIFGAKPMVFSASRFELLAANPLDFFFKFILRVEPPEEYDHDPSVWLDPLTRGSLLHAVFHHFLTALVGEGVRPEFKRDWPRLKEILDRALAETALELPPASPAVMESERRELVMAARIFLIEEEEHCRGSEPRFLEAAIGLPQEENPTAIDCETPVTIALPGGRQVAVRGLVDRIDRLDGPDPRYVIWDYKTGRSGKYKKDPPFWAGRCVQNALYSAMVQARLDEVEPGAKVAEFGYFFPTDRERGERISWTADELTDGPQTLADLCDLAARGAFPVSDDHKDVGFSDRLLAFGDLDRRAEEIKTKLAAPGNDALDPLRRLRPPKAEKPTKEKKS